MTQLRAAIVLSILFTLLTGLVYPLAITGLGQVLLPHQANGSLIKRGETIIGSALVGQHFASDRYFQGRPSVTSAVDPADATKTIDAPYNAANSTGSNLGPSSKALAETMEARAKALGVGPQPADMVTASASGLDPHITPSGAGVQIARIAKARGKPEAEIRALVERHTEGRDLGVLGQLRINVLVLNLALDAATP
ncbi:MAG: potassium-transporting ATPase subunit KdpC [Proteobacteria bacterium]|nr:potassium-transporting ATPase subunit KdpC [Pseudomonadota bacterium]